MHVFVDCAEHASHSIFGTLQRRRENNVRRNRSEAIEKRLLEIPAKLSSFRSIRTFNRDENSAKVCRVMDETARSEGKIQRINWKQCRYVKGNLLNGKAVNSKCFFDNFPQPWSHLSSLKSSNRDSLFSYYEILIFLSFRKKSCLISLKPNNIATYSMYVPAICNEFRPPKSRRQTIEDEEENDFLVSFFFFVQGKIVELSEKREESEVLKWNYLNLVVRWCTWIHTQIVAWKLLLLSTSIHALQWKLFPFFLFSLSHKLFQSLRFSCIEIFISFTNSCFVVARYQRFSIRFHYIFTRYHPTLIIPFSFLRTHAA